ncbi:ATPase [Auraticoccus sp. F435]|uniref:ATPase n=1 Tax=Auraticoccus cholistanensis TaxID=2656650 RepID=A0A6A9URR1_9ACTN|nr:SRPBCC family protein [Auraticoccus cholistanensis]MVA75381.1 ATPase [Auraticoccus cholistanensis]
MKPVPTGQLTRTADGADLVLVRTHRAPVADVWAALTEPERTARWFGSWSGPAGPGRSVELTLTAEEGNPTTTVEVLACTPPVHLRIRAVDEYGTWDLEARLAEADGVTTVELVQHLADPGEATSSGPGWEYYLDRLLAVLREEPMPDFADYHPALVGHYEQGLAALDGR